MWLLEQCSDAQQYSFSNVILAHIHLIVRKSTTVSNVNPYWSQRYTIRRSDDEEKAKPEVYSSGNILSLIAIMHNSLPRGEVSIYVQFHFDKLHSMHLNLTTKLVKL